MAGKYPPPATKISIIFLLLFFASSPAPPLADAFSFSFSLPFSQYRTLFSISRTLILRVANLRASRGDVSGSARAWLIAEKMERWLGLGFLSSAWSVGWDYARNYAWGGIDYDEMYGAIAELNELMGLVGELTGAESDVDRVASAARNYGNALRVSKRLLRRLLKIFGKAGALREFWEMVQTEVVDGGLLKDCLEVGSEDVKGLLQVAKEMALKFFSAQNRSGEL
ncbi:PREDICTED: uncharacterized protein LOC104798448 [Tarenaya hassleriana]|uniref:uncharacterized protein LOC104798448 n=1 Tax=Tarenaya hassleriana TaxID=28532 RepID=UPI00053C5F00|nr:PREDICTED: uncharacterized protein LOC104798448 [Tarenaya hassleriana]XP_010518834.1 PREDICTED: uncharacterized protein LOC104798448 [Tarenaya hassleriana]